MGGHGIPYRDWLNCLFETEIPDEISDHSEVFPPCLSPRDGILEDKLVLIASGLGCFAAGILVAYVGKCLWRFLCPNFCQVHGAVLPSRSLDPNASVAPVIDDNINSMEMSTFNPVVSDDPVSVGPNDPAILDVNVSHVQQDHSYIIRSNPVANPPVISL